jgi:phosphoesterase RecJ-like protein
MPDGDALGSALALAQGLMAQGKRVEVVCQDPVPELYSFLPGSSLVLTPDQVRGPHEVAVFLDCTDASRVGEAALALANGARVRLNVDHHVTNSLFGDMNYVDPQRAAVGEQVYLVLQAMGVKVGKPTAMCLYVAIATDTGQFCYSNTTVETHRLVASLLEDGANPAQVSESLYESRSLPSLRLLSLALGVLRVSSCGQVAWVSLSRSMLKEAGARDDEAEGLINYPRSLEGVAVGILLKEIDEDRVKVSFRSRDRVDVSRLAASLGGGGHPRAAGCLLEMGLQEAEDAVVRVALEAVREDGGLHQCSQTPGTDQP